MATDTAPQVPAQPVLWNGERIKGRWLQTRFWAALIGLLGVGLIAGLYFGIGQVDWFVHIGPVHFQVFYLKPGWDAGTWWPSWIGHWADYRHYAFRDQLEPAIATVLVLSVLAGEKYWNYRLKAWQVAGLVIALIACAVVLGVCGVYLRDFGLPGLWAHAASGLGHPGYSLRGAFAWAGKASLFTLAWGALMGFALHKLWAPAGATIQGYWTDRLADGARTRNPERPPWYVRYPFSAPVIRERISYLFTHPKIQLAKPGRTGRWIIATVTFAVVLLIALGLLAKYGIGHGLHVTYLAPPPKH